MKTTIELTETNFDAEVLKPKVPVIVKPKLPVWTPMRPHS